VTLTYEDGNKTDISYEAEKYCISIDKSIPRLILSACEEEQEPKKADYKLAFCEYFPPRHLDVVN
jgi:hypothetical protein